jgi:hypothetical protein
MSTEIKEAIKRAQIKLRESKTLKPKGPIEGSHDNPIKKKKPKDPEEIDKDLLQRRFPGYFEDQEKKAQKKLLEKKIEESQYPRRPGKNPNRKILFEVYHKMGADRDLAALARAASMRLDTLLDIYTQEGWSSKVKEMDDVEEAQFEQQFKEKSKKIRETLLQQITSLLGTLESGSMGLPLTISSVQDLKTVSGAYAELVKATDTILRRPQGRMDGSQPSSWSDLLDAASDEEEDDY